jgi:thioredoxin 1
VIKLPIDINRDNFENEIIGSKKPVMVDFWGPQCKPCLALMPSVEQLEQDYSDSLKIAKINASENRMLCAKLRVMSLPTFIFYKDGIEVSRLIGEDVTKEKIVDSISAVLNNR